MQVLDASKDNNFILFHDSIVPNQYRESFVFMDESEYEFFEERAAIMEFDGKLTRDEAEQLAYRKIVQSRKLYSQAS